MRSRVDHRSRREARTIAKTESRRDRVIRVCPLGACALVDGVPGDEVGAFAVTGGSGGSVTSASVKTGFGASAGGKAVGLTRVKRAPGWAGAM